MHALDGHWELVRAELAGEESPQMLALHVTLELTPGHYTVRFADKVADRGIYAHHPGDTPATLTLVGTEGPNAGRTIPCIYQLVGHRLRVCYGLNGAPPTGFATSHGSAHYLATYRRKPPSQ